MSYCNRDCQKAHFKTHKKECAGLAQEYVKTHEPKMASRAPPRETGKGKGIGKWEVSFCLFDSEVEGRFFLDAWVELMAYSMTLES